MQQITRQLARVRRTGRWLLIGQRSCQLIAGLALAALLLGVLDFALRLPAAVRAAMALAIVIGAGVWLARHLTRALRFAPSLSDLALRAERLNPQLAGWLATAVEFTLTPEAYRQPSGTAAMAEHSVRQAERRAVGVDLGRLINPTQALRALVAMLVGVVLIGAVGLLAPGAFSTAASRWLSPWAGAEWPRRTEVEHRTTAEVWPSDAPLRLSAAVTRGHRSGMRVWINYRLIEGEAGHGSPQSLLMNEQADVSEHVLPPAGSATREGEGLYEQLIDLPAPGAPGGDSGGDSGGTSGGGGGRVVEYDVQAGDDRAPARRIRLVDRPRVVAMQAALQPPAYAADLVTAQSYDLHGQSGPIATAAGLIGSTVTLHLRFNKPLTLSAADLPELVPGLNAEEVTLQPAAGQSGLSRSAALRFVLRETVETPVRLIDEHGLTNLSERRLRIEAVQDKPPVVALLEPDSDQSVLPSAVVNVSAMARDDVGVSTLTLHAELAALTADDSASSEARVLAERIDRQSRLEVAHELDLSPLKLAPGAVVTLSAVAGDVYELDGQGHDPVRSAPRRLRIIDQATLIEQIRAELAAVRRGALRLEQQQAELTTQAPADARPRQARVSRQLDDQAALLERQQQRMAQNRLAEPSLEQITRQAGELIERAAESSAAATEAMDRAQAEETDADAAAQEQAARERQAAVRTALSDLVALLDQGQDALALQLQLRQIQSEQAALEAQTRRLLPQTLGRSPEELPEDLRHELSELAQRQAAAAEQANAMVSQMRAVAAALAEQPEDERAQATAEALAETAAIAEREQLDERMQEAGEALEQNQLSQAGNQQNDSLETLGRMLQEMGRQQERMQAMLRRRMQELAQTVQQLIERQQAQLAALAGAQALAALEPEQAALRRATMAAEELANREPETAPVAAPLGRAVSEQGVAIQGMRAEARGDTEAGERAALEHLEHALEVLKAQREQAEQDEQDQQRAELREAYLALAERQDALRGQVIETRGEGALNRAQRAALIGLGQSQAEIQQDAQALAEQVVNSLLFEYLHGQIDAVAGRAAQRLRRAMVDAATLGDQQRIARMLRDMAAALDTDAQPAEFAGDPGEQQAGAGGAGGGAPPLVPPIAELRLLRGMQAQVYDQTRQMDEQVADEANDRRDRLLDLAAEQRQLGSLGQRLIEQLQQHMPAPAPEAPEAN